MSTLASAGPPASPDLPPRYRALRRAIAVDSYTPPAPRREDPIPTWEGRKSGSFPIGIGWEITPSRAEGWLRHGFAGMRGDSNFTRSLGDLAEHEMALLLWDLDCYEGLFRRWERGFSADPPPPIHEYLRPGREHWGSLAALLREWMAE